nr:TIMELESS [Phauda flammans]
MEWVLRSPQIHTTFSNLGFAFGDGYHVNENCNAALETILNNILTEDKYLRTYRRSISFGQNVKKDLIPLLINAKEDKTVELLVKILVNITIPVECLLSVETISKTDFGRHTIFEINNLLTSTKQAFTDQRATKVLIEYLKKNFDVEQQSKLTPEQCKNISNSLLLIRNILHIPEETSIACSMSPDHNGSGLSHHTIQNQILWNIFSQSVDKILIKLMTIPEADNWGVTMVQVIALLYKDQHVVTLRNYLQMWLEASLSESSEDNESNTSPPVRGSEDSSPILTSDPTSDSSDNEGSRKSNDGNNSETKIWDETKDQTSKNESNSYQEPTKDSSNTIDNNTEEENRTYLTRNSQSEKRNTQNPENVDSKKMMVSESSDCGYGTQENHESISTTSNENELPAPKPVHNPLNRMNINKGRAASLAHDRKRKKVVKRGKSNILNVQGLSHSTPTDDDISNVLKEFTVDFLLKGYNSLVQTLHSQILTNLQLEMDTSHFFWLITYFLKFATQIELDLQYICCVLSYEIVSYLSAEGVNLCEQFELALKLDGNDLKPSIRRLHLVVTAIREFVQAMEVYNKNSHMREEDKKTLLNLQIKMCETEELRSLLVLLLRYYSPKYHTKQYLQDLIVTNHILLMFMDTIMKSSEYIGPSNMINHLQQFTAPEIMHQYSLILEDYATNGEFINDCIFTIMHHVGGELGSVISLFQPKILKIFTSIWKSEFDICEDWSDLIEYVINTFIKKPHVLQSTANFRLNEENFDDERVFVKPSPPPPLKESEYLGMSSPNHGSAPAPAPRTSVNSDDVNMDCGNSCSSDGSKDKDRWAEDELSSLSWIYIQCNTSPDLIAEIVKVLHEDGIKKTRDSVIRELFRQKLISKEEYETLMKNECDIDLKKIQSSTERRDDEISKLCEQLVKDGKLKFIDWVQKVLLDTCYAKIHVDKKLAKCRNPTNFHEKIMTFALFKKCEELPVMSPISYHSLLHNKSVPLVPWNCEQASICKDLKFLQLLHKLGFYMPVDTGKVFIRIPHFWTAEFIYEIAGKLAPIDPSKIRFSINDISNVRVENVGLEMNKFMLSADLTKVVTVPSTTVNREENGSNWLDIVQKSNDYKLLVNMDGCETASVASDLTRMYVSDEDEKPEVIVRPIRDVNMSID